MFMLVLPVWVWFIPKDFFFPRIFFSHSYRKYLFGTCHLLLTILSTRDTRMNKTKPLSSSRLYYNKESSNRKINRYIILGYKQEKNWTGDEDKVCGNQSKISKITYFIYFPSFFSYLSIMVFVVLNKIL